MSFVEKPSLHSNAYLLPPHSVLGGIDSLDSITGPPGKRADYK